MERDSVFLGCVWKLDVSLRVVMVVFAVDVELNGELEGLGVSLDLNGVAAQETRQLQGYRR